MCPMSFDGDALYILMASNLVLLYFCIFGFVYIWPFVLMGVELSILLLFWFDQLVRMHNLEGLEMNKLESSFNC